MSAFDVTTLDRSATLAQIAAWISTQPNTAKTRIEAATWACLAGVSRIGLLRMLDALPEMSVEDRLCWAVYRKHIPNWTWSERASEREPQPEPVAVATDPKARFVPPPPEDDSLPF